MMAHYRFDPATSDVNGYMGHDADDGDADQKEDASHADDESTQNVEDLGPSTWEGQDWTVHFRPVKYDNGEANAMASDVSKAKSEL